MTDPSGEEESPSLAAMISAMQAGEPVDKDALREALLGQAKELGISGKVAGKVMGRARWEAERKREAENRGEEEAG